MSQTETKCPGCGGPIGRHPTLRGFDVGYYRCDPCGKNWAESDFPSIAQLINALLGRKPKLVEVNDEGEPVSQ